MLINMLAISGKEKIFIQKIKNNFTQMKIKDLIKILEKFNPDGEVVQVYDCQRSTVMPHDISIYNGKMPLLKAASKDHGRILDLSEDQEKNLSNRDCYNTSWALIIENK